MVGPVPVTPFARQVIVDAGDHYETGTFRWWSTWVTFDPDPIAEERPASAGRRRRAPNRHVREFLVWSRFPFWTVTQERTARASPSATCASCRVDPPRELHGVDGCRVRDRRPRRSRSVATKTQRSQSLVLLCDLCGSIFVSFVLKACASAQRREILHVERIRHDRRPACRSRDDLLRLDQDRQPGESRIVEQPPERLRGRGTLRRCARADRRGCRTASSSRCRGTPSADRGRRADRRRRTSPRYPASLTMS